MKGVSAVKSKAESIEKENCDILDILPSHIAVVRENARLKRLLRERAAQLEKSRAMLSRAQTLSCLGNLAACLAHEIRNPLTSISTFIQMLPEKYEDEEFRRDFYEIALDETGRINIILTELLDLARPRESPFGTADLNDLVGRMVLLVSAQAKVKRIDIVRSLSPEVGLLFMDQEKMKQVFLNLLTNAVEFSPKQGRIKVATGVLHDEKNGRLIFVEVGDSGPGVAKGDREKIFEPYFTTRGAADGKGGTGLGLFIAKQNMADHGGTIEVRGGPGRGAVFRAVFPGGREFRPSRESTPSEPGNHSSSTATSWARG